MPTRVLDFRHQRLEIGQLRAQRRQVRCVDLEGHGQLLAIAQQAQMVIGQRTAFALLDLLQLCRATIVLVLLQCRIQCLAGLEEPGIGLHQRRVLAAQALTAIAAIVLTGEVAVGAFDQRVQRLEGLLVVARRCIQRGRWGLCQRIGQRLAAVFHAVRQHLPGERGCVSLPVGPASGSFIQPV